MTLTLNNWKTSQYRMSDIIITTKKRNNLPVTITNGNFIFFEENCVYIGFEIFTLLTNEIEWKKTQQTYIA